MRGRSPRADEVSSGSATQYPIAGGAKQPACQPSTPETSGAVASRLLSHLSLGIEDRSEATEDHSLAVEGRFAGRLHSRVVHHLLARRVAHVFRWPHDPRKDDGFTL